MAATITIAQMIPVPQSPTPPRSRPASPEPRCGPPSAPLHIALSSPFGSSAPDTPPSSPPRTSHSSQPQSLLNPPNAYPALFADEELFAINADELAAAMHHASSQPLPEPAAVFPWLHGLHPQNLSQLNYFNARSPTVQQTPDCIRGLMIVKVGGNPSRCRIKGAVLAEEILEPCQLGGARGFRDVDPKSAICPRNFQIQTAKMATVSDIVIYGDDSVEESALLDVARNVRAAQVICRLKRCYELGHDSMPDFNTFVLTGRFSILETFHPDLIALDREGRPNPDIADLIHLERLEMSLMSRASEIAPHVWLGCSADLHTNEADATASGLPSFSINVECIDDAVLPSRLRLKRIASASKRSRGPHRVEFPASVAYALGKEVSSEDLLVMCRWIDGLANQAVSSSYDSVSSGSSEGRQQNVPEILIHCQDGYTETTLLAICFYMYANGVTLDQAYQDLHTIQKRNFYNHPQDLEALKKIEHEILAHSPKYTQALIAQPKARATWFEQMQGSLPSRILPYMYLGNLGHANNQAMVQALGISRIVSVGESITWTRRERVAWGEKNILHVKAIQDNGSDSLTDQILHCLDFIESGKDRGLKTLVHCRVGVSRSATICIAEVMKSMNLSFPRAYSIVRSARLSVLIQPTLLFCYELMKFEESLRLLNGQPARRDLEWTCVSGQIAALNRPYTR